MSAKLTTLERRDSARLQERVVNAITATGTPRKEISAEAGVGDPQVSRWCAEGEDHRQVHLWDLVKLIRRWGADVVLAPLAAIDGCIVLRPDPTARGCARTLRRCVYGVLGHVEDATGDGSGWDREEAARALPEMEAAHAERGRMLEEGRAAARGRGA